jgi:3-phosphoshikimate 1-carboxyvinyltransferase
VIEPLRAIGAAIAGDAEGRAPLAIVGGQRLAGAGHALAVASAQVKSALLLAGLYADGPTRVREPHPTRDYTERMLSAFGAAIATDAEGWIELRPGRPLRSPGLIGVPGDLSSAAFFVVAACLVPGSDLLVEGVGLDPRRAGLLATLREMGASIQVVPRADGEGSGLVDLAVRHSPLRGVEVPASRVPDMIDEFPALFAAAALAEGTTRIGGAAELRVKESDRIAVMATALRSLGARIDERPDGADIHGGVLAGGAVDSGGDHRCAMALAVAAQCAAGPVRIGDCANVATSFPDFVSLAGSCGMRLHACRPDPT